jgi:hypothetical protein
LDKAIAGREKLVYFAPQKSSFPVMISPFAPTLPLLGAGAYCDAPA